MRRPKCVDHAARFEGEGGGPEGGWSVMVGGTTGKLTVPLIVELCFCDQSLSLSGHTHDPLEGGDCGRGQSHNVSCDFEGTNEWLRTDLLDEAYGQGLLGCHRPHRQRQVHRPTTTDQSRKSPRSHRQTMAWPHEANRHVWPDHPQVGGYEQLGSATDDMALRRCDEDGTCPAHELIEPIKTTTHLGPLLVTKLEVDAGREAISASGSEDHDAGGFVSDRTNEIGQENRVQSVHLGGAIHQYLDDTGMRRAEIEGHCQSIESGSVGIVGISYDTLADPMTTHVPYQSKTDLVAQALKNMIESGELEPGTFLRQRDVAEMLGVSPTPVREAFRRLEGEGYIVTEPHRASVVVRSENSRLFENAQIRAALESLGAFLAAAHITDEVLAELEDLNQRLAESADIDVARKVNRDFHFLIYDSTESPVLLAQLNLLWRTLGNGPHVNRSLAESARQHEAIIQALRDRDAEGAAEATRQHILEAHQELAE